jgi:hypothetical protein
MTPYVRLPRLLIVLAAVTLAACSGMEQPGTKLGKAAEDSLDRDICDLSIIPGDSPGSRLPQPTDSTDARRDDSRIAHRWAGKYARYFCLRAERLDTAMDLYNLPIIGAAATAVGLTLYRSSLDAVAGAGLAGGTIAAIQAYDRPDKDQSGYLQASAGLKCIYDASHGVELSSYHSLVHWRTELLDAVADMNDKTRNLAAIRSADPAVRQFQMALAQTQNAATAALATLNNEIKAYEALSTAIYAAGDTLIYASLKTTLRAPVKFSQSVEDLKASIQAADQNQAKGLDARAQLLAAKAQTQTAQSAPESPKHGAEATATAAANSPAPLKAKTGDVKPAAPAEKTGAAPAKETTADTQANADREAATDVIDQINNGAYGPLDRTQIVTEYALDAIPSPSFTEMTTNIQACAPISK